MRRREWFKQLLGGVLVGAALTSASSAGAMRYVEFNILLDRKLVLRTSMGDSGSEDADTVWRYLNRLPLRSMNGYAVKADPGRPLRATLKGKVTIQSLGGNVTLDGLHLVRSTPTAKWLIDPKDVRHAFSKRTLPSN